MSGTQVALMALGAMMDKENRARGAALGLGVGTAGAQLAGMTSAGKAAAGAELLTPMGPDGVTFLTAAPEGAGFGGLLNSMANSNNPLTNQAMQSLLNPMGGGGGNQQIVQSGTGIEQGDMNQMEGDPVGQFLQAKVVKQPKKSLISIQTNEDDDRYLIV